MKQPVPKAEELKRVYRLMCLFVVIGIALTGTLCLFAMPHLKTPATRFGVIGLIPSAIIVVAALWSRSRLEKAGISGQEWMMYNASQPLSIVVMSGMVIFVVLRMLGLLK